jgi:DNA invertase Pin-like site-specific DNA recombinase
VAKFLGADARYIVGEFVEMESGRKSDRPQLLKALAACRYHRATLVVARLDRLARNAAFLLTLRDAGVQFVCADAPHATRLTIGIMAVVAEAESDAISARVRDGIAAAKERGVKIGTPGNLTNRDRRKGRRIANAHRRSAAYQRIWDLTPVVRELRASGARSHEDLANALNERGIPTPTGRQWTAGRTRRLLHWVDDKPSLEEALRLIRSELRHRGGHRERNVQIYRDRLAGRTLDSLAREHGLTDERIRQLCTLATARRVHSRWDGQHPNPMDGTDLRTYLEQLLMEVPTMGYPPRRPRPPA